MLENPLILLFLAITAGLLLGKLEVRGLSLGSSGVIFAALVLGHYGYKLPEIVGNLGLVLFVYCLGISAGPRFFRVFRSQGKMLAVLGCLLVVLGGLSTWTVSRLWNIPTDLAAGLFAGALTSTPALAAATESLPPDSQVAVGFGIAYPFGVLAVVLFVQLLPKVLGTDFRKLDEEAAQQKNGEQPIERALVEVQNPRVVGKRLSSLAAIDHANCQVSRVLRDRELRPIPSDFTLSLGQKLLLVGTRDDIEQVAELLGSYSPETDYIADTEHQRMKVIVTSRELVGKSLKELRLLSRFGVTISRITRNNVEFVPNPHHLIEYGDALTAVGEKAGLKQFAAFAGHREKLFYETDLISIGVGVLAGIMLGLVSFELNGQGFSLGIAGGPLLVGLLLGHLGHIGPIVGQIPRASRLLMTEIGLVFFLATAGMRAGGELVEVVKQYGIVLCIASMLIAFVPMILGFCFARLILKLKMLETLGAVCGGMTSTPGLGVISGKTESEIPIISYAAAYPVALILMTILAKALVMLMG